MRKGMAPKKKRKVSIHASRRRPRSGLSHRALRNAGGGVKTGCIFQRGGRPKIGGHAMRGRPKRGCWTGLAHRSKRRERRIEVENGRWKAEGGEGRYNCDLVEITNKTRRATAVKR